MNEGMTFSEFILLFCNKVVLSPHKCTNCVNEPGTKSCLQTPHNNSIESWLRQPSDPSTLIFSTCIRDTWGQDRICTFILHLLEAALTEGCQYWHLSPQELLQKSFFSLFQTMDVSGISHHARKFQLFLLHRIFSCDVSQWRHRWSHCSLTNHRPGKHCCALPVPCWDSLY